MLQIKKLWQSDHTYLYIIYLLDIGEVSHLNLFLFHCVLSHKAGMHLTSSKKVRAVWFMLLSYGKKAHPSPWPFTAPLPCQCKSHCWPPLVAELLTDTWGSWLSGLWSMLFFPKHRSCAAVLCLPPPASCMTVPVLHRCIPSRGLRTNTEWNMGLSCAFRNQLGWSAQMR